MAPAPFVHEPSVYSSMPPQQATDASWQYSVPYQEACLGGCNDACTKGQKFTCVLTPHNQRICSWK